MKISVLTPTYNRANTIGKLYDSLVLNSQCRERSPRRSAKFSDAEWLIMDDGSTDSTKELVQSWIQENKIDIKYFYQENQGKMTALNNLTEHATGNVIIECDSDDYFTEDAFKIIAGKYQTLKKNNKAYALMFLKYDQNRELIGSKFKSNNHISTNFDLYFKEGLEGDKALVFKTEIRKQYKHKLENNEKFVTEARMYHQMDLKYKVICFNEPIMICEYRENGYSSNIQKIFKENPYGYYKYFKEILGLGMKKVSLKKKLYVIKHYILFTYLTKL